MKVAVFYIDSIYEEGGSYKNLKEIFSRCILLYHGKYFRILNCYVIEKYEEGTKRILGTTNQAGMHVYILSSDLDRPILLYVFTICSAASVTL